MRHVARWVVLAGEGYRAACGDHRRAGGGEEGELGTFVNMDGTLWLMAPFTGNAWMIGRPAKAPFWRASLASDHSQVHVQAGGTLLTWRIPVARTPADTRALIESLVQ